jgi:FtsH-binding integral membrane protein
MGLDIRLPIGLMFTFIGVLLTGYGLFSNTNVSHAAGESININLIWGIVLLIFGVLMLLGALKGGKNPPKT